MLSGRIFQRAVPRAGERRDPVLHHQERELHLLRGSTFKYLFSLQTILKKTNLTLCVLNAQQIIFIFNAQHWLCI